MGYYLTFWMQLNDLPTSARTASTVNGPLPRPLAGHQRLVVESPLLGVAGDGVVHLLLHGAAGLAEIVEGLARRLGPLF